MSVLVWILAALAAYRLTLLVVADKITEPIRDWILAPIVGPRPRHSPTLLWDGLDGPVQVVCNCDSPMVEEAPTLRRAHELIRSHRDEALADWREHAAANYRAAYLLTCPWCASVWLAPAVVGSAMLWGDGWGWQLAAGALAVSAVVGFLASFASPD